MTSIATHILLVEDNPIEVRLAQERLAKGAEPFVVTCVETMAAALECLQTTHFDAVLFDLALPDNNGVSFLERIVAADPHLPIVVLTGLDDESLAAEAIRKGAQDYLVKDQINGRMIHRAIRYARERKRAEEKLQFVNAILQAQQETSPDGILIVSADSKIISFNQRFVDMWEIPADRLATRRDDLVLQSVLERLAEPAEFLARVNYLYEHRDEKSHEEIALIGGVTFERHSAPMFGPDGKTYGRIWYFRDITKRKRAEEALRQEQQFSKSVLDSLPGIFYLYTYPENQLVLWNKQHESLLGFEPAEMEGRFLADWHPPEARETALNAIDELMNKGQNSIEASLVAKDGHLVPFVLTGVRFEAKGRLFYMGIGIDISDRKRAEKELCRYRDRLEELVQQRTAELVLARDQAQAAEALADAANRAKSVFLATMSHEIRTPMTAILGYADLLMDPMLNADNRKVYASTIRRSGEHLLCLINDILDLSKIEAGKLTLDIGRCHIAALLGDIASMLRPRAKERGIFFSLEFSGPLPETVATDSARLRQAIINLAGNAIKFTEQGGVRIVASFLPETENGRPAIRIDVIDTGIGISENILPRLFHAFTQGDASVTRKYGGTGLGLTISHHIARLLGGDVTVKSELGRGSTFTLIIPAGSLDGVPMLQNPSEVTREDHAKNWVSEVTSLTGVRILLAEDGIDNRELIQAVLERVGAQVETAENGRIAVETAQDNSFDLILMDMNMPEMDGYEATGVLRDRGYAQPIIALTANAMLGDSERCQAAGCNEYLAKPIDRRLLIQTIAKFVKPEVTKGASSNGVAL
jgi:PAS domain S-box-containing protein